jgi:hypothetical protein
MVRLCGQAASMLDGAADDWSRLLEAQEALWPIAIELTDATDAESFGSGISADVRLMTSCLIWVQYHRYDALETDLKNKLDVALRCAMHTLDRLEQLQPADAVA